MMSYSDAHARSAIGIAASTGGPRALSEILARLPGGLPGALLIVQHMPAGFTRSFAERLEALSELPVVEAKAGQLVRAGCAYVAPAGVHMALRASPEGIVITLEDGEAVWGVKPAADVLFQSIAEHYGVAGGGVVLTGMGRDGASGLRAIRNAGGWTAVQDSSSSVIYGMPRHAAEHADEHYPLEQIAEAIAQNTVMLARKRRR